MLATRRAERSPTSHPLDVDGDVLAMAGSPELGFLRQEQRTEFRAAFEAAARSLTDRQRSVLRQSIVNRLTVRQLARMYGVHYATVSRWITDARNELVGRTRDLLGQRFAVAEAELDEFMGAMTSQLDLTLSRILHEP